MALYVDSAYLDDVARVRASFPVAGVTMNPSILLAAWERGQHLPDSKIVQETLGLVDSLVFAQPTGAGEEALYAAASVYLAIVPDRVVPKLLMTTDGLRASRRIVGVGGRVSYTAVASLGHAYCASVGGASWIIPYFSRLRCAGIEPSGHIAHMAQLVERQQVGTRLLVASVKSADDVAQAVIAGAHDITTTPEVIESLAQDDLTTVALLRFEADWSRLNDLAQQHA
jgi:transaldolase